MVDNVVPARVSSSLVGVGLLLGPARKLTSGTAKADWRLLAGQG